MYRRLTPNPLLLAALTPAHKIDYIEKEGLAVGWQFEALQGFLLDLPNGVCFPCGLVFLLPLRATQTPYRKAFPLRGRPNGLKLYRGVRSKGPPLPRVGVGSILGRADTIRLRPGGLTMNIHKLRMVMDYIRRQGGIPIDGTGRRLTDDETLTWYGMDAILTADERQRVKQELAALAEVDRCIEMLRCGTG